MLWAQMAYLSAIKKYTKILTGFLLAALTAVGSCLLLWLGVPPLTGAFLGSTLGYFLLMVLYLQELVNFYPAGRMSLVVLFPYLDKYKSLIAIGFFTALGLFAHNFVFWFSDYKITVIRHMIYCMKYDVACFYASLTIVPYLVIFVVALEVNFYKAYRKYFDTVRHLDGHTEREPGDGPDPVPGAGPRVRAAVFRGGAVRHFFGELSAGQRLRPGDAHHLPVPVHGVLLLRAGQESDHPVFVF